MEPNFLSPTMETFVASEKGQRIICCSCHDFGSSLGQETIGQECIKDFVIAMAFPSASAPLSSESPATAIPRASYVLEVQRRVAMDGRDYTDTRYFVPSREERGKCVELHIVDAFQNLFGGDVGKGDCEYLTIGCPHHQPPGINGISLTRTVSIFHNREEGARLSGTPETATGEWFKNQVKHAPISIVWR
jgi:hypothetical protein